MSEKRTLTPRHIMSGLGIAAALVVSFKAGEKIDQDNVLPEAKATQNVAPPVVSNAARIAMNPPAALPPSPYERLASNIQNGQLNSYYHGYLAIAGGRSQPLVVLNPYMVPKVPTENSKNTPIPQGYDMFAVVVRRNKDTGQLTEVPTQIDPHPRYGAGQLLHSPDFHGSGMHQVSVQTSYDQVNPADSIGKYDSIGTARLRDYRYSVVGDAHMQPPSSNNESHGLIEPVGVLLEAHKK